MRSIVALVLLALSAPALAGSAVWSTTVSVDEFTDEKKTMALVTIDGELNNGFIALGCFPSKRFEGKISTGHFVGDKDVGENIKFRVDANDPVSLTMRPANKPFVYFNDPDSPFVKQLLDGEDSVVVQLTNYQHDVSKATFSLNGAKAAIRAVLEACR